MTPSSLYPMKYLNQLLLLYDPVSEINVLLKSMSSIECHLKVKNFYNNLGIL